MPFRLGAVLCLTALLVPGQALPDYEKKVTEFTLPNGLHFILLERHQAPVVSFHTYVNAGSAEDPAGKSGLAALIARLGFSGTETIGTRNWPEEKQALAGIEAAYDRMDEERAKGPRANEGAMAVLQTGTTAAVNTALAVQNPEEYRRAIEENGGVDLDSHATPDSIETSYSLPSNRIELWFLLESQRMAHPVLREFYQERQKLALEAGAIADSRSAPKVQQALLATAFENLPYRNPVSGWPGDVITLRTADAKTYMDEYCGPGNTVIALVGDVDPTNARRLAERYFGPIPARPLPALVRTQELAQTGPKTVAIWGNGQPAVMIAYKRPPEIHRDDAAFDVIATILGDSHSGWLQQELIEDKQIAQRVQVLADVPAARYPNLFVLEAAPAKGHTVEEDRKAIEGLVARLQARPVDSATLTRVRNILRGNYLRRLGSNRELAALLPAFSADYGDWRRLFTIAADYDRLNPQEIQRVALEYLVPAARTVAYSTNTPPPGSPGYTGGPQ